MKVIFGVAVLLCLSQARILPLKAGLSFKEKLALETQRKHIISSGVDNEEVKTTQTLPKTTTTEDFQTVFPSTSTISSNEVVKAVTGSTVTSRPPNSSSTSPATSQPHYVNSSAFRTTTAPATTSVAQSTNAPVAVLSPSSTSSESTVVEKIPAESLIPSEGEGDLFPRTKPEFLAPGIRPFEPVVRTAPRLESSIFDTPSETVDIGDLDYDAIVFPPGRMRSFRAEFPFIGRYRTAYRPFGF